LSKCWLPSCLSWEEIYQTWCVQLPNALKVYTATSGADHLKSISNWILTDLAIRVSSLAERPEAANIKVRKPQATGRSGHEIETKEGQAA
jgi:hypothetical protein